MKRVDKFKKAIEESMYLRGMLDKEKRKGNQKNPNMRKPTKPKGYLK